LFAILSEPAQLAIVVDRVVLALSEMFAADIVVLLRPACPEGLVPLGAIGLPEELVRRPFSCAEGGYADIATQDRVPVLVENALGDPKMDPQFVELGVEAAAWLPILGSQAVLGVLVLGRCQPILFDRSDADMLMAMAYRIGLVLERAQAEEARRGLESRLRHAEKAESLGRMAGAIAHHFNNKLTAVQGSLELALDDLETGQDARIEIANAQEATRQASMVSGMMLAYLGQSFGAREPLDLVVSCREALPDLTRSLPVGVRLRAELPDRTLTVRASAVEIRQVLANLVSNAGEAMAALEGQIVLSVREVPAAQVVPSPFLSNGWTPGAGPYACVEVSDRGSGMDPQTLQNAFDPFFTTKFTGRGLGLPVVLGVVRAHHGTVTVESEPGRGSTFRVFLPLTVSTPQAAESQKAGPEAPKASRPTTKR
jgi:signal transduction histidine kinase